MAISAASLGMSASSATVDSRRRLVSIRVGKVVVVIGHRIPIPRPAFHGLARCGFNEVPALRPDRRSAGRG